MALKTSINQSLAHCGTAIKWTQHQSALSRVSAQQICLHHETTAMVEAGPTSDTEAAQSLSFDSLANAARSHQESRHDSHLPRHQASQGYGLMNRQLQPSTLGSAQSCSVFSHAHFNISMGGKNLVTDAKAGIEYAVAMPTTCSDRHWHA